MPIDGTKKKKVNKMLNFIRNVEFQNPNSLLRAVSEI